MRDIQEVFNRIDELKKDLKEYKTTYRDALTNADNYEETTEKIKELKEKKKQIELRVQGQLGQSYARLEELKEEIEKEKEMLNDIAITTLMDGKTVAVKDGFENNYEPVWTVRFRKMQ